MTDRTHVPRARWAAAEGAPYPLGAKRVPREDAMNFALYSKHAQAVTLLLYGECDLIEPLVEYRLDYRRNKSGRIWHCRLPLRAMKGAVYYAYRVDGPPRQGRFEWHAFDPQKVLLDPYAASVFLPPTLDRLAASRPGSNAGATPLGVLPLHDEPFDWHGDRMLRHEADTIVYELHVAAFTRHPNSNVSSPARGTFAGVIEKIPYLLELGVTVVELMPVFQFDPADGDFWGYDPLSLFAPHAAYGGASTKPGKAQDEFRRMVKALHAAGIEVVLDVVYNHTCEGDHAGPVYSYKGIDNSTYYLIGDQPEAPYLNFSGTGNTLNCANRYVRKMIMDSVRHWVGDLHIDGLRLDLASVFARNEDGSLNMGNAPLMGDLTSDAALASLRLIVEPWDAAGTYQLGRAFPGIMAAQWNARFRDDVRRFVRGDGGMVGALMQRLYGSDDLFPDDLEHAYHPYQSVNFVTCHDGFTLYDLVSYNEKHNSDNGHGNADGMVENWSWNCGWEGDEGLAPDVLELRKRQARNFCCLLLLANGTPMLRAGDEFLHTQRGNNNPYNQDNATSWLDWSRLDTHADVFRFVKLMVAFRKAHPSMARSRFWHDDVRWYGATGTPDLGPASREIAFALHGASEGDDDLYVMVNAGASHRSFAFQEAGPDEWRRVVDTSLPTPQDIVEPENAAQVPSVDYLVSGRSVAVFIRTG